MTQLYQLKIVPNNAPNAEGRWIERALEKIPDYDTEVMTGWHIVAIRHVTPAPTDQPFYMHSVLRRNG